MKAMRVTRLERIHSGDHYTIIAECYQPGFSYPYVEFNDKDIRYAKNTEIRSIIKKQFETYLGKKLDKLVIPTALMSDLKFHLKYNLTI